MRVRPLRGLLHLGLLRANALSKKIIKKVVNRVQEEAANNEQEENIISKGKHTYDNDCDTTCNKNKYR